MRQPLRLLRRAQRQTRVKGATTTRTTMGTGPWMVACQARRRMGLDGTVRVESEMLRAKKVARVAAVTAGTHPASTLPVAIEAMDMGLATLVVAAGEAAVEVEEVDRASKVAVVAADGAPVRAGEAGAADLADGVSLDLPIAPSTWARLLSLSW